MYHVDRSQNSCTTLPGFTFKNFTCSKSFSNHPIQGLYISTNVLHMFYTTCTTHVLLMFYTHCPIWPAIWVYSIRQSLRSQASCKSVSKTFKRISWSSGMTSTYFLIIVCQILFNDLSLFISMGICIFLSKFQPPKIPLQVSLEWTWFSWTILWAEPYYYHRHFLKFMWKKRIRQALTHLRSPSPDNYSPKWREQYRH